MTAAQAAAFDQRCLESSQALWPGSVVIGGVTYDCALVIGSGEGLLDEGGIQALESVSVEISRDLLEDAPGVGTVLQDASTSKRYEITRVLAEATRWLIRAARFPS